MTPTGAQTHNAALVLPLEAACSALKTRRRFWLSRCGSVLASCACACGCVCQCQSLCLCVCVCVCACALLSTLCAVQPAFAQRFPVVNRVVVCRGCTHCVHCVTSNVCTQATGYPRAFYLCVSTNRRKPLSLSSVLAATAATATAATAATATAGTVSSPPLAALASSLRGGAVKRNASGKPAGRGSRTQSEFF